MHDRGRRADVGADQQCAGGLDRDLHQDRQVRAAGLGARRLGAVDRGLDLQGVLAGLDQDAVDAAGDQAAALDGERPLQRRVVDMAERRQPGSGPDRAEHEALPAVGEEPGRLAGDLAGPPVDLEGLVLELELGQRDRRAAEGVGLDDVGAGGEVGAVDLPDHVGPREVEHLGAVLLAAEVTLQVQVHGLDQAAHGAVAEQHPLAQQLDQRRHLRRPPGWARAWASRPAAAC